MEGQGGYNRYFKQAKTNSALTIHSGNNNAAALAAAVDAAVAAAAAPLPTANVNVNVPNNNIVNHNGKQPLPPLAPKSCVLRDQGMYMPIANVIRIMRRMLPPHAKISDEAKQTMQECVSEFISFITSEANVRCHNERRKILIPEDITKAMETLGLQDYHQPLTIYVSRYRQSQKGLLSAQNQPNTKHRDCVDGGEVVDNGPPGIDAAGPLPMDRNGPIGSIGPAAYDLSPQEPINDPLIMNNYNFKYNISDSAGASTSQVYHSVGASSSQVYVPEINPNILYK